MLAGAVAVLVVVGAAGGAVDAGVDWGAEAFAAPVEVLRAATSPGQPAPADADAPQVHWLYRSVHWSIDGERRVRRVDRDIVRVDGADAVRDWSTVSLPYTPSHEAAPVIRARVVTADGRVFQLTPEMIHEDAAREEEAVVSDTRTVSAALPGVRRGAVVELELTWQTNRPLFAPAQAGRLLVRRHPVAQLDVTLEHPRGVPLSVTLSDIALKRSDEDGGPVKRVRLRGRDVAPAGGATGRVTWTTGTSWQAVARGYLDLLAPARAGKAPVDVASLVAGAKTRREKAQRLLDWLHQEVRYTGLEFGDRSIVPWSPAEVVKRGFGDCKDLALLLVELLGAAGVDARLALLDTDGGLDAASPSLAFFDHAIVYLPAAKGEGPTWLDATAPSVPAGLLPAQYAGVLALVVDPGSTRLVPTWSPTSADSARVVDIDVTLPDYGAARATVSQRLTGLMAAWARRGIDREGADWMKVELQVLGNVIGVPPLDPVREPSRRAAEPVEYAGAAARVPRFYAEWTSSALQLPEHVVFDWLPDELTDDEAPKLPDGKLSLGVPHVATVTLRVHPAAGTVLVDPPRPTETRLGPAVLRLDTRQAEGGAVELSLRLDSGPREYSRAQVDAFRAAYAAWKKTPAAALRFVFEPDVLEKQGKLRELVAWYAKRRAEGTMTVGVAAREAGQLLQLGLVDAARERSRRLVVAHHDAAVAWVARAWVLSYDRFGNAFSRGFDRPGALAALRRAHELEPGCTWCLQQVSWFERYDDDGAWLSPRVDPGRAVQAFTAAWPNDTSTSRWVELMLFAEDWAALRKSLTSPSTAEQREAILLADQMVDGAPTAWHRWSARVDHTELAKAADAVIFRHLKKGRLPEALALARAAGLAHQVAWLERLSAQVAKPARLAPEMRLVGELLQALADQDEARQQRFAAHSMVSAPGGREPATVVAQLATATQQLLARTGLPLSLVLATLPLADARIDAAGQDRRVGLKAEGYMGHTYLVRRGASWRVLVVQSSRDLAARALELMDEKRPADARVWVTWAREAFELEAKGPDAAKVQVVASAWPADDRLLAAALATDLKGARRILGEAVADAPPKARSALLWLLVSGAGRSRAPDEARQWVAQLEAFEPNAEDTFIARTWQLAWAGDLDGREASCKAWLERLPGTALPMRDLASIAGLKGQFTLATTRWREVMQRGLAQPDDYNSAAWVGLFSEGATPDVVAWATRAGKAKQASWATRHTLATVLASEAKDVQRTLTVFRGLATEPPQDAAWLVPARLAHRLGLRDEARALYRRVAQPTKDPQSAEALAAKWLAELEQEAAEGLVP